MLLKRGKTKPMSKVIRHKAFVKIVNKNSLLVTIVNQSACSLCDAKSACNISDFQEKDIEITGFTKKYSAGEEVTILFKESSGFKALFYGYLLPLILLLATLIVSSNLTGNQGLSGLLSIGILVPYYVALHFFRDKLKNIFQFKIDEST